MLRRLVSYSLFLSYSLLLSCTPGENLPSEQANNERGKLILLVNGEDLIRQGFVSKDGWQLDFDHVYVTLNQVIAYQTAPPFNTEKPGELKAQEKARLLAEPLLVDLARGDESAAPILVAKIEAKPGIYNALSWQVVAAREGKLKGKSIVLQGKAQKGERELDFLINLQQELDYQCGEYVGAERKGILKAQGQAELETTFHFDHIFGNAELDANDALNKYAIGFEPFAALAKNNQVEIDEKSLAEKLSSQEGKKFQAAIAGLGHVGEGHCRSNQMERTLVF